MEGSNRVKSVNGNTAGDDNLGGEIQVQTHDLSNWQGFFNPMIAKTGSLRDPGEGEENEEGEDDGRNRHGHGGKGGSGARS